MRLPGWRTRACAAALLLGLLGAPFFADAYVLSLLTLVFFYAYLGQAWNLMMGYAGQLSLGHALFFGLGAYAAVIGTDHFGLNAWLALLAGMALSACVGALIAALGFRFNVRGVHFALLTIAAAEFTRVMFDNWDFVGASAGYFLRVSGGEHPLVSLRGGATFFYYAFLALMLGAFAACAALVSSRLGYCWRALREDEDTARALGVPALRMKVLVVVLSAAMTSLGGSMFALMTANVYPETVMGMRMSIDLLIAPIIGGLGTIFGPLLGALFVVPLMELSNHVASEAKIFGLSTLVYGLLVILTIRFLPEGIWPPLHRWLEKK